MSTMLEVAGYRDVVPIGHGGLGDVYRARRESTGGLVALKVIRNISDDTATRRRVTREVAALVELKGHPYVVHVEEVVDSSSGPIVVMEYAPHGSLHERVRKQGRLSPAETVLCAYQVAQALRDAHARGIVHRDVKPLNILVGEFGQVKLCDFGIAAIARRSEAGDRTSALSYRYASPEELEDRPDVGSPADIYSLGVTVRHLATGAAVRSTAPPEPDSWTIGLSHDDDLFAAHNLYRTVETMLAQQADARPTAADLVDRFERLVHELGPRRVRALAVDDAGAAAPVERGANTMDPVEHDPVHDRTNERGHRAAAEHEGAPVPPNSSGPTPTATDKPLPRSGDAPEKWW